MKINEKKDLGRKIDELLKICNQIELKKGGGNNLSPK